jgi:hypothetical protein
MVAAKRNQLLAELISFEVNDLGFLAGGAAFWRDQFVILSGIMYWRPWRWTLDGWYGAWLGAVFPAVLAEVTYWLHEPLASLVLLIGVAIGAFIGGAFGERVVAAESSIRVGLRAGVAATVVAGAAWYVGLGLGTLIFQPDPIGARLGFLAFYLVLIPLYSLMIGLPIALPIGVASAAILRTIRRHRRAGTAALVVCTAIASALGGAALLDRLRA